MVLLAQLELRIQTLNCPLQNGKCTENCTCSSSSTTTTTSTLWRPELLFSYIWIVFLEDALSTQVGFEGPLKPYQLTSLSVIPHTGSHFLPHFTFGFGQSMSLALAFRQSRYLMHAASHLSHMVSTTLHWSTLGQMADGESGGKVG